MSIISFEWDPLDELASINHTSPEWDAVFGFSGDSQGWSLGTLKDAFRDVACKIYERIDELEKKLDQWDSSNDALEGGWHDACESCLLEHAATTQAIIGLIAPLAETLIYSSVKSFEFRLKANGTIATGTNRDDRTALNKARFWDPCIVYRGRRDDRSVKTRPDDLMAGFDQLLTSTGHGSVIHASSWNLLKALRRFRNQALHHAMWPQKKMTSFYKDLNDNGWSKWFNVTTSQIGGTKPIVARICVTRRFIDDAFIEFEQIARSVMEALRQTQD